jgi:cytochrome c peroxidase
MADQAAYEPVREEIKKILIRDGWDEGHIGPILVRLAFHASGTYDKNTKTGGSNGARMRFQREGTYGENKGLENAHRFLEVIKTKFPWISYSDLWTLAAVVALEEMAIPGFDFKINWIGGRVDEAVEIKPGPHDLLPGSQHEAGEIRKRFNRMGFMDDEEIVVLLGAHAIGKSHQEFTGHDGAWTRQPNVFANQFFSVLSLHHKQNDWVEKNWAGPRQFRARDTIQGTTDTRVLTMLPSDMELVRDPLFAPIVEKYAPTDVNTRQLFYDNFAKAFGKLLGLGVPGYEPIPAGPDVPVPVPVDVTQKIKGLEESVATLNEKYDQVKAQLADATKSKGVWTTFERPQFWVYDKLDDVSKIHLAIPTDTFPATVRKVSFIAFVMSGREPNAEYKYTFTTTVQGKTYHHHSLLFSYPQEAISFNSEIVTLPFEKSTPYIDITSNRPKSLNNHGIKIGITGFKA